MWCRIRTGPRPCAPIPARHCRPTRAPSDAIVLFDGKDVSAWRSNSWRVVDGVWETAGASTPRAKVKLGSFQLPLEWQSPANFKGPWYNEGNNGVLIHGLYEIPIFDSFNVKWARRTVPARPSTPPLVNACRPQRFEGNCELTPRLNSQRHAQEVRGNGSEILLPAMNGCSAALSMGRRR